MPIPTKTYGKGRSGVADVIIHGDKVVVTFEDNDQTVTCLLEDSPSYIREGRQAVTMSADNTQIFGARPIGGTYRCVFAGFAARENEPPTIREVAARSGVSRAGKKYHIKAHLEFTALFDIVAGKWKDYRLVYNLQYGFEKVETSDGEAVTLVVGTKLAEFLDLCGMDFNDDTIPWSDNVLVFLEKILKSRKRQISVSLTENGWVKDISALPEEDEEEDEYAEKLKDIQSARAEEEKEVEEQVKKTKEGIKAKAATQKEDAPAETKSKAKVDQAPASVLDMLASNAKEGDKDAVRMLATLAKTSPEAQKILEDLV